MTKDQAAKLAQAYQWLSEGKDVECREYNLGTPWKFWDGKDTHWATFRLKPEPLLERWANVHTDGCVFTYFSPQDARDCANKDTVRIAVHMREVPPESNT